MLLISIFVLASALLVPLVMAAIIGRSNIRRLRQVVATHYGQKSALDGYFRYASARADTPIKLHKLIIYYIVSLFVLEIISSILTAFNDALTHEGFSNLVGEYFYCSFIISFWLLIFSIAIATDPLALRAFQVNDLPGGKYKQVYLYNYFFPQALIFLPSLVLVGIVLYAIGGLGLISDKMQITIYSALIITVLFSGDLLALQHERRKTILQPIESTRWAYLEPRIAAWCRLVNVRFGSIQVAHDIFGRHTVRVVGMGQKSVLIISETLLRATDWRQKDALICLGIAMQQKRLACKVFLRHLWLVGIFLVWLGWLQAVQFFPFAAFRIIVSLLILIGLPIIAIVILVSYPHRAYRDLDRLATQLTGDPLALIAIQHLIAALNGFKFDRRQRFFPSPADRIEALIKLSKSAEARAPYAADPIPAILYITVNGAQVSVPLTRATPLASVPGETYTVPGA